MITLLNTKTKLLFSKLNRYLYLVILSLFFSCNQESDEAIIKGKIENANNKKIQLEEVYPGFIDTIAVTTITKKGEFYFKIKLKENTFHRLKIDDNNIILLKIYPNDNINIKAKFPGVVRNYEISGNEETAKLKELSLRLLESADELNKMKNIIIDSAKIIGYNIDSLIELSNIKARKMYEADKKYITDFIKSNHKLSIIYTALYQYIGVSPIILIDNDIEIFEYTLENLKKYNSNLKQIPMLESEITKYKLKLKNKQRVYLKLKVGDLIPDFSLPDFNSKTFNLYSIYDKEIIIIFWASWSKASVQEILKIKKLKNRNPDIELILVSLDNNKKQWLSSINNYSLDKFINLCDFNVWESPVVFLYGIKKIPFVIYLDKEKRIKYMGDSADFNQK